MYNKMVYDKVDDASAALSTIAILRRHPMYDSLVLVKKYRPCLDGYILEFPTSHMDNTETNGTTTNGTKLNGTEQTNQVHTSPSNKTTPATPENNSILGQAYDVGCGRTKLVSVYLDGDDPIYQHKLKQQNGGGEQHESGEVVYVPINGLLHRLNNYDRHGISIDSRVYAFAMGLKTAERFLTSSTEKEVQEAPPL
uniref:ADP-sugar pyrophosphatase n=1 Tax=Aceria tosichella TaxID=561515 RepID=A0A6G1SAM0_9ACAR